MKKVTRAVLIFRRLDKAYPDAKCELNFKSPLELIVATILSAQCTDARVNEVTPELFKKYKTALDYAKARPAELENIVRPTGFFKNKTNSIIKCCASVARDHGGNVPQDMEQLTRLAGVGRKTANVVRAYAFGLPGIIVDTHFLRVTERLALTKNKIPEKVEADLAGQIPKNNWSRFSTLITAHGRRTCKARKPLCPICPVLALCPYKMKTLTS